MKIVEPVEQVAERGIRRGGGPLVTEVLAAVGDHAGYGVRYGIEQLTRGDDIGVLRVQKDMYEERLPGGNFAGAQGANRAVGELLYRFKIIERRHDC